CAAGPLPGPRARGRRDTHPLLAGAQRRRASMTPGPLPTGARRWPAPGASARAPVPRRRRQPDRRGRGGASSASCDSLLARGENATVEHEVLETLKARAWAAARTLVAPQVELGDALFAAMPAIGLGQRRSGDARLHRAALVEIFDRAGDH